MCLKKSIIKFYIVKKMIKMKKLEFMLQACLEEYKSLRAEIMLRIQLRQNLINYVVLIYTGALTFSAAVFFEKLDIKISNDIQVFILLIIPWVFYPLALIYFRHDWFIAALAGYIEHEISPKMYKLINLSDNNNIIKKRIWKWEIYIHAIRKSLYQKILAGVRYIPFLLPCLISILLSYDRVFRITACSSLNKYKFYLFCILGFNTILFFVIVFIIIFETLKFERGITKL